MAINVSSYFTMLAIVGDFGTKQVLRVTKFHNSGKLMSLPLMARWGVDSSLMKDVRKKTTNKFPLESTKPLGKLFRTIT